jgi:hypothetical protein
MNYFGTKFISPVFTISMLVFCFVCGAAQLGGGVGPCGPNSLWGIIWLVGYPIGFIGMLVGVVLSLFRTYRYFHGGSGK